MTALSHIAKAVHHLESCSFSSEVETRAKRLAYSLLRVVILGGNGKDIICGTGRLCSESEHHSRKRVRDRIAFEMRELRKALSEYPDIKP